MFLKVKIFILIFFSVLSNISHVFIDEAHERDVNIDLLLLLMKELIEKNDRIRIVIMSATINAELFQNYFNNCPLLCVPGFMHEVKTYFIDVNLEHSLVFVEILIISGALFGFEMLEA